MLVKLMHFVTAFLLMVSDVCIFSMHIVRCACSVINLL
jgi:hypothetical protein